MYERLQELRVDYLLSLLDEGTAEEERVVELLRKEVRDRPNT